MSCIRTKIGIGVELDFFVSYNIIERRERSNTNSLIFIV